MVAIYLWHGTNDFPSKCHVDVNVKFINLEGDTLPIEVGQVLMIFPSACCLWRTPPGAHPGATNDFS